MSCDLCGGKMIKIVGNLPFKSKVLGIINVPGVNYAKCASCHDVLVDFDKSLAISKYLMEQEKKFIESLPISEFISLNQAADILKITKQAFSKNPRIKRGFVYSAEVGGRLVFYKKSVEEFQKTGDGRILIDFPERETKREVINNIVYVKNKERKSSYNQPEIYGLHPSTFINCTPSRKHQRSNYLLQ